MSLNIALEREQQQRVANYVAALDSQREYESIEAIKRQGREDGLSGLKPFDPYSLFYFSAWAEGYREYVIAEKEKEFLSAWEGIPF